MPSLLTLFVQPIAVYVEEGTDISAFEGFTVADAGGESAPPAPEKKEEPKKEETSSSAPVATPQWRSSAAAVASMVATVGASQCAPASTRSPMRWSSAAAKPP